MFLPDDKAPNERPPVINREEAAGGELGGRPRLRAKAAGDPRMLEFIEHLPGGGTLPGAFVHLPAADVPGPMGDVDRTRRCALVPKDRAVRGRSHALQPPREDHPTGGFQPVSWVRSAAIRHAPRGAVPASRFSGDCAGLKGRVWSASI